MSLKELKKTLVYKGVFDLFRPEYQFLVEEAAKKLIVDVVEYESPSHQYIIHEG